MDKDTFLVCKNSLSESMEKIQHYLVMMCLKTDCKNNDGKHHEWCKDCPINLIDDILIEYWSNEIDKKELLKKGEEI